MPQLFDLQGNTMKRSSQADSDCCVKQDTKFSIMQGLEAGLQPMRTSASLVTTQSKDSSLRHFGVPLTRRWPPM